MRKCPHGASRQWARGRWLGFLGGPQGVLYLDLPPEWPESNLVCRLITWQVFEPLGQLAVTGGTAGSAPGVSSVHAHSVEGS